MKFPCRHRELGCLEVPTADAWLEHCDNCAYRPRPMSPGTRWSIDARLFETYDRDALRPW